MATGTLTGSTIAATYKSILKVKGGANQVLDGTPRLLEDGDGNDSLLGISTDSVLISGSGTRLDFNTDGSGEYLSGDGTDLTIASGADIHLTATLDVNIPVNVGLRFGDGGENIETDNTSLTITAATVSALVLDANSRISLSNNDDSGTGNTVFGYQAGNLIGSGDNYNVFIGHQVADADMTNAVDNTAVGYSSMSALTEGDENACFGRSSGGSLTTGDANTAIGYYALPGGQVCSNITAVGRYVMGAGTVTAEADGATGVGYNALAELTSGARNTAVGMNSADAITSGSYNVALGGHSLGAATTALNNTAIGYNAMADVKAAVAVDGCVAVGWGALKGNASNTTGINGTVAIGYNALAALTTGDGNTAVGYQAGMGIIGAQYNTLLGTIAGTALTSGYSNTLLGWYAGRSLTQAYHNIAIGHLALGASSNTASHYNIAIGSNALDAIAALESTNNVAIGYNAGTDLNNAADNTLVGHQVGANITDGNSNTCIGSAAGDVITSGTTHTIIGAAADPSGATNVNQIVIGYGTTGVGDNTATIGAASTTDVYMSQDNGAKVWCTNIDSSSDARIKKNVEKVNIGLDFVNELNPVTFNMRKAEDWDEDLKKEQTWYKKNTTPRDIDDEENKIGFIAQEVKASLDKYNVDCDIHTVEEHSKIEAIDYSRFVVPLVKAVQELSQQVEDLKAKIN